MNLYYITHENEDGESMDLFVQAVSPLQAFTLVKEYWHETWDYGEGEFNGDIISALPERTTETCARIFEIKPNGQRSGVFDWLDAGGIPGELNFIGYVDK